MATSDEPAVGFESIDALLNAYEHYQGDNVDHFIQMWMLALNGDDSALCSEAEDRMHQVTQGSCDLCGEKNMEG